MCLLLLPRVPYQICVVVCAFVICCFISINVACLMIDHQHHKQTSVRAIRAITLQQLHHVFRLLLWSLQLQTLRDMGNRKLATSEEKHFMFMWSRALRACCLGFADYKMPDMCYRFTIDHREFLRKEEYRMSFAFHLSNLFNFRLIPPDVVSNCLKAVEDDSFYEKLKEVSICRNC